MQCHSPSLTYMLDVEICPDCPLPSPLSQCIVRFRNIAVRPHGLTTLIHDIQFGESISCCDLPFRRSFNSHLESPCAWGTLPFVRPPILPSPPTRSIDGLTDCLSIDGLVSDEHTIPGTLVCLQGGYLDIFDCGVSWIRILILGTV